MATTTAAPIRPSVLVELLAGDQVLAAARQLLAARVRREVAADAPNEDSATNGQPWANTLARTDVEARDALEQLVAAIDRAARRLAKEATK